ncbi:MAG: dihydroorotase [Candidatus Marinimicrobia bacterium]|nr:dihydroorotase [Candidatus Neomarinimicrobiota bacterium]
MAEKFSEHESVLIKNGTVVGDKKQAVDILIEMGIIREIGNVTNPPEKIHTIDLKGAYISPGWADVHVHLREPGREDEETIISGSDAAMAGGFTAVCCMPNTNPPLDSEDMITSIKERAAGRLVEVYPIGTVSKERKGEELAEIGNMFDAGAVGFSDDGDPVENEELMRIALEYSKMFGVPIVNHSEVRSLAKGGVMNEGAVSARLGIPGIPPHAEDIMVARDIRLIELTDGILHVPHISSKETLELVRRAKAKGLAVTCEVTPHHISLTDSNFENFDAAYKVNPPLRTEEDVEALRNGLADGTIDCIASDHAPHSPEENEADLLDAPFGLVGLETAFAVCVVNLLDTKVLNLGELVEKLSTAPRKIYNLPPAEIKVGENANMTFFDTAAEWRVDSSRFLSQSRNTPYEGMKLRGKVLGVVNRNKVYSCE